MIGGLFIPPPGALQVEMIIDPRNFPEAQSFVWVYPEKRITQVMECGCALAYEVVEESLSPQNRIRARMLGKRVVICDCDGRVIE